MKLQIMNKTTRILNRTGLKIKQHSPEILMAAGIVGTVASTVMACKATTKATGLIEEAKKEIEAIHTVAERSEEYSEKDLQQALTISYARTGVKLFKLYAPAIALGALSITSIVASHNILKKRNIALAAAYAVVDNGFKKYRKNVVERFGEELDKEFRYGVITKEVDERIVDEHGNEKIEKKTVKELTGIDGYSQYARFYDDGNKEWSKDPEANLMFLRCQQNWANEKLRSQGYLFLNEVYDSLGIPRTQAGQVVGWVYDEKNPVGDNYVDFGIYTDREGNRNFVNGYIPTILLDFNVDGVVWDILNR